MANVYPSLKNSKPDNPGESVDGKPGLFPISIYSQEKNVIFIPDLKLAASFSYNKGTEREDTNNTQWSNGTTEIDDTVKDRVVVYSCWKNNFRNAHHKLGFIKTLIKAAQDVRRARFRTSSTDTVVTVIGGGHSIGTI